MIVRHHALGGAVVLVIGLASLGFGQGAAPAAGGGGSEAGQGQRGGRGNAPAAPAKPTPRKADGKPVLGTMNGENALWLPAAGGAERFINADNADPVPDKLRISEVPMQPWARALLEYRIENQLEPHTRCKPSGGPRQFLTPYGVEIVELPELQQVVIFDLGGPHTYRTIYMDGRAHPKDLLPRFYGHST